MREYAALMQCIGIGKENAGPDITPKDFASGMMILGYDAAADQCNSFHTHSMSNGNIGVELSFKEALTKPIKLIVYSVYHNAVTIDAERNVKVEYLGNF